MSRQAKVTDAGEGLSNYYLHYYPPTPFGYFPRKGGRCCSVQLTLNHPASQWRQTGSYTYNPNTFTPAVIQSPTAIQGRRISKTFSNPVTDTSKVLSSRTCFRNLPALTTSTHPNLPSREGTCAVAHLTPMSLVHLITRSLDHFPQKEVCA